MSRDGAAGAGGAGGAADAEDAGARSRLVRRLLEHAVALLPADRHPHIVASARYMLADGYLPAATDPARPVFHDDCEDENEGCKEHVAEDNGTECGASGSDDIVGQNEDNKDYLKGKSTEKEKEDSIPRERSEDNTVPSTSKGTVGKESLNENTSEQNADRAQNLSEQDISENMSKEDVLALQVRGLALHDIGDRIQDTRTGQKPKTKSGKGLTLDLPDRCTKALSYALEGLKVLHNVTLSKSMEEERERLKQQIINEEQHPKMANPFEPIKMDYQPLNKQKAKGKENKSKNKKRRNKKSQETEERSENFLLESKAAKDLNAILVLKDENVIPSLQEPNRDDSFAWKLHLKTLLYEKICLAYATLAEYSYTQGKYGYSLKYIDMASRCQTLLSNMIIKSKVVDVSCLIGRVGDNYLQLSKNLDRLEKFKAQLETDLEIDKKIKLEIEIDLVEECEGVDIVDEFEINVDLYESETETLARAVREYRRAGGREQRAAELRRRLACALNELGVRHMHDGHDTYTLQYAVLRDKETTEAKLLWRQVENSSRKCEECLQEAFEIFEEEKDMPNLALLCCNKARYLRFKAHCLETLSAAGMRGLYTEAERLYQRALKYLGPRDSCGAATIWDLVNWELSSHLYNRAVYMYDYPEGVTVHDISTAFKHALKNCLLSPGPKQYLYQFRAAMIHYKLGSLYKTQYRMGKDEGGRRRATCVAACEQYEQAAHAFAALEDCAMHLTVRLEHADLLEAQARLSPNLILKSLQDAIQVLSQCQSVIKLIKDREPEEQPAKLEERQDDGPRRDYLLLEEFRNRLHLILQNIIRYCASKSNKDYDKLTATYKDLYRISLTIKQNDDVRKYAESIYNVLQAMSSISMDS